MQQECSCGDSCPLCERCDSPLCECYCDFEPDDKETETEDETDDMNW